MLQIGHIVKDLALHQVYLIFVQVQILKVFQTDKCSISKSTQLIVVEEKCVQTCQILKRASGNVTNFVET